jgi:hypothetical protein
VHQQGVPGCVLDPSTNSYFDFAIDGQYTPYPGFPFSHLPLAQHTPHRLVRNHNLIVETPDAPSWSRRSAQTLCRSRRSSLGGVSIPGRTTYHGIRSGPLGWGTR